MTAPDPSESALPAVVAAYRDAIGTVIADGLSALKAAHGQDLPALIAEALDQHRRAPFLLQIRLGRTVEDSIHPGDYPSIVEAHWDSFAESFSHDREHLRRMRSIEERLQQASGLSEADERNLISDILRLLPGSGEDHQLDELREAHANLRLEITRLESTELVARQSLQASLDNLELAQRALGIRVDQHETALSERVAEQDQAVAQPFKEQVDAIEARVIEQGQVLERSVKDLEGALVERVAELERAFIQGGPAYPWRSTNIRLSLGGAVMWAGLAVVVAVVLQVAGIVELSRWPPEPGSLFTASDADTPGVLTAAQGTPTPLAAATTPATAVASHPALTQVIIANTGPDGMGPEGPGVPHRRRCIADQQFLASDRRWLDGTVVSVKEIGASECFSWILVEVEGDETWVRDEYVWVTSQADANGVIEYSHPNLSEYWDDEDFDTSVRLAVFLDGEGNRHWLVVEEFLDPDIGHGGGHATGSRGKLGGHFYRSYGQELGFSYAELDSRNKILAVHGSVEPNSSWRRHSLSGSRVLSARYGWFEARDIEWGTYVEIFDFPVRAAADGTIEH